jgi:hypothetical protein
MQLVADALCLRLVRLRVLVLFWLREQAETQLGRTPQERPRQFGC